MAMRLRIITPRRQLVDAEVSEITAPGEAGELGVLPEHTTFLGQLDQGVLTYIEGGAEKRVFVAGGYAEVMDDVITVLADEAEFPDEIDAAEARAELASVEGELAQAHEDPEVVAALLRRQRRAEIRSSAGS